MNWNQFKDIVIALLVIACIILALSTTCSNNRNKEYRNNIEAFADSLHSYKLKNGELLYSKKILTGDLSNAEQQLGVTKKQLKEIERQLKSKTEQLTKIEGQIKIDTIIMRDSVFIEDSILKSNFNYKDQWLTMNGQVTVDKQQIKTSLHELTMDVPVTYGVTDKNDVFVTTENPYVSIKEINGMKTYKKTPHWNIGFQLGFGAQYDLRYNTVGYGPYFGIGISYGFCF